MSHILLPAHTMTNFFYALCKALQPLSVSIESVLRLLECISWRMVFTSYESLFSISRRDLNSYGDSFHFPKWLPISQRYFASFAMALWPIYITKILCIICYGFVSHLSTVSQIITCGYLRAHTFNFQLPLQLFIFLLNHMGAYGCCTSFIAKCSYLQDILLGWPKLLIFNWMFVLTSSIANRAFGSVMCNL